MVEIRSNQCLNVVTIIILLANLVVNTAESYEIALHKKCQHKCGNVSIPYPFGIGKGCYYDHYQIRCENGSKPIYGHNIEVLDIALDESQIRLQFYVARTCYNQNGSVSKHNSPWSDLSVFTVNTTMNVFGAVGCDTQAWFSGTRHPHDRNYSTGCMTSCFTIEEVDNGTCSGVGCCLASIPEGITYLEVEADSFENYTKNTGGPFLPCSSAFIVAKDSFNFTIANLTTSGTEKMLPALYDWAIGTEDCSKAKAKGTCLCKQNTECHSMPVRGGYRCSCLPGYTGNPYLPDGCQDIDECDNNLHQCVKPARCHNTDGNYTCQCPKGFHGAGTKEDLCVVVLPKAVKLTAGIGGGIIILMAIAFWLYWRHEKKQLLKAREAFFQQNGGHVLLQKLSQRDMSVDMVKIFTIEEIKKATHNFSENNVIGRGGFGMVYKGILANNQVVAIKKSLKLASEESEQFINEVIVLSRLNNRHVVKLLGCCLETEVPLLVYEFVSKGTLHEHLHDEKKASLLTWEIRLRIALEVAEVLSYLHTTAEVTIIHRDVKSMNILLDQTYSAKVSDFGASRLVSVEQDQLATVVLGTRGYLDPEYMQTSELTEKSDVYSFGVVLVEILTREDALSYERPDNEVLLANLFLRKVKEDRLLDILDDNIMRGGAVLEQLNAVADLATLCLKLRGEDRPTMKDVALQLQKIRGTIQHHLLGEPEVNRGKMLNSVISHCESMSVERR